MSCLAFREDGVLASGGYDRTVRTWDARLALSRLRPQRQSVALVEVKVDDEGAVVGTDKAGQGVAWSGVTGQALPRGAGPVAGCRDLEAVLTPLGEPLVIDDENTLMTDPAKLSLMNALCQTNPEKTLRWDSTTRLLEEWCIPSEFTTRSPVL